jgi:hypothetical protein
VLGEVVGDVLGVEVGTSEIEGEGEDVEGGRDIGGVVGSDAFGAPGGPAFGLGLIFGPGPCWRAAGASPIAPLEHAAKESSTARPILIVIQACSSLTPR